MKKIQFKHLIWLGLLLTSLNALTATAKPVLVKTQQEYRQAAKQLQPGDEIILANGVWQDFEILFVAKGSAEHPVKLSAQTPGQVILSGQSNLRMAGEYLEVSGLVFKHGYSPTGEVIAFRQSEARLANHSRVTNTVIDRFNNPDKFQTEHWVVMYGRHNRFDHNHIEGKSTAGVTMAVRLNTEASQQNHHQIDHNYFGPRPVLGSNGGETLRIGTSKYSLSDSFTRVESNYFEHCDGEVEIISNKSGKNEYRNNVFFESRGTLTLRHGNCNVVEGNIFLGNGVDHTGGIRVINADQIVRNNYLSGLTGTRFGAGLVVMNGVPNSAINRYHQVKNALISNNSLIDIRHINLAAGSDKERTATPVDSVFSTNLIVNRDKHDPLHLLDKVNGIHFSQNVSSQHTAKEISEGFSLTNDGLEQADNGLWYPSAPELANIGAPRDLTIISKDQVGVFWYAKLARKIDFNSGRSVAIGNVEQLVAAVAQAKWGDRLLLAPGRYNLDKILSISTALSIQAAANAEVRLYNMRSVAFELEDGASLKLQGLIIDGSEAPDAAGNVLIRNSRLPTLQNYSLELEGVQVINQNVNHSFHIVDAGYRSFADLIRIADSRFANITGDILRLNKEQDDLGIYNAEYVSITHSSFSHVEGGLANIYRGGTDESTFGPHVEFSDNQVTDSCKGKRNKSQACLLLHGTQVNNIRDNHFTNSATVVLEHTVGEPHSNIINNVFDHTPLPSVKQLFPLSGAVVTMSGNQNL